jgi:hypothetical protein
MIYIIRGLYVAHAEKEGTHEIVLDNESGPLGAHDELLDNFAGVNTLFGVEVGRGLVNEQYVGRDTEH